jgi:hypothetical protein
MIQGSFEEKAEGCNTLVYVVHLEKSFTSFYTLSPLMPIILLKQTDIAFDFILFRYYIVCNILSKIGFCTTWI